MIDKIGERETIILDALVEAWNTFVSLESTHPDDLTDFRRAIHECQRIIALRQLRRINPDIWASYPQGESDDR